MILQHIKSDVYHFIASDYLDIFLTEKELIKLISDNDIADIVKTPIGYLVNHDLGVLPVKRYLSMMSQSSLELLAEVLLKTTI
jgi:hypothetical protein